jgi:enamine deaminase RidA (YjgF/YER057c/UK114 family)
VVAQVKAACGDLDRVARCLKLNVFIASTADFTRQSEVANGASELIAAIFGEAGKHARSSVGVAALPRGAAVEVDAVFELQ